MSDRARLEIQSILSTYRASTLREMGQVAGVIGAGVRLGGQALVDHLRQTYFEPTRIRRSLASLSAGDRAVLVELARRGGIARISSLRRDLIAAGIAVPTPGDVTSNIYQGSPLREHSRVLEDILARLTLRGLVFTRAPEGAPADGTLKLHYHPGPVVFAPEVVLAELPPPPEHESLPEPPRVEVGNPDLLLRDLYLYWSCVRRTPIALNRNGSVPKRTLKALSDQLLVPDHAIAQAQGEEDTERLLLLRRLLEELKLLRSKGNQLGNGLRKLTEADSFWNLPRHQQLLTCLDAWMHLAWYGDLGPEARRLGADLRRARAALRAVLQQMGRPGRWLSVSELAERLRLDDAGFMFRERQHIEFSRSEWYHGYAHGYSGTRLDILRAMEVAEDDFLLRNLRGVLHALGVVDLGYDGERLLAWRLTELGAHVLEGTAPAGKPGTSHDGRVIVQPSFQILALGPVSLGLLARLDSFAERVRADAAAFEYRLTRESVYRAQEEGIDSSAIVRDLEDMSSVGLPQNVRRSLEEWDVAHRRITIRRRVSLLQAATPELLTELQTDEATSPLLARTVAPDVSLVATGADAALIAALLERGILPAVADGDPASADGTVEITAGGDIRPVHPVPDLRLKGRLRRLAEPDADGRSWHLTPRSIRRAGGSKARVLRALAELEALACSPLPPELVERIKVWGSFYGDARAASLVLIEFRDQETLSELRQRPDLADLLRPFAASDRALATVAPENLERVRAMLEALGITVHAGL
ncbi:MAG: helicase-associated domain-containing protein [Anaerolineae bacterium]